MARQGRKEAVAAYKERAPAWGVFAIQCTANGKAWVGCSRHVDTQKNGLWFALKMGASPFAGLQAAWSDHEEIDFRFEELDRLTSEASAMARTDELKRRQTLWARRLGAERLPFA